MFIDYFYLITPQQQSRSTEPSYNQQMLTPWWGQSPADRGQHQPEQWPATHPGWRGLTCLWRRNDDFHLKLKMFIFTWLGSWTWWELLIGGSCLMTWVPWSDSPADSPGAQSSAGQGPPHWGLAPVAWGQRRSGLRAAAVGQLRTRRHGAAQDWRVKSNYDCIMYHLLSSGHRDNPGLDLCVCQWPGWHTGTGHSNN